MTISWILLVIVCERFIYQLKALPNRRKGDSVSQRYFRIGIELGLHQSVQLVMI